jgi:hypothetical protein
MCSDSDGYIPIHKCSLLNRAKRIFQVTQAEVLNSVTEIMHTCRRILRLLRPEEV